MLKNYISLGFRLFLLLLMALPVEALDKNEESLHKSQSELALTFPFKVTDLAGRELSFSTHPKRLILGESRYLFALSILNKETPLDNIVGALADLKQIDYGSYKQYQKKFPHIDDIPLVGHTSADSFSVEKVLSLKADLAIFGVDGHGPNSRHAQLISQLERAGVQVTFIDFRNDPIINTPKSIALLGKVLGYQKQAKAYIEFYQQQLALVTDTLAKFDSQLAKPKTFLHSRVGLHDSCCETMVKGMMATFLQQARGHNIADSLVPGHAGNINLEHLLVNQPDIYIATAIGSVSEISEPSNTHKTDLDSQPPYIVLGAGVDEDFAQASFERAFSHTGLGILDAVTNKRSHAIWHHFYNTPLNVVAVQVFAKWLYPDAFSELDPKTTLEQLFLQFQSVPLEGTYWLSLKKESN